MSKHKLTLNNSSSSSTSAKFHNNYKTYINDLDDKHHSKMDTSQDPYTNAKSFNSSPSAEVKMDVTTPETETVEDSDSGSAPIEMLSEFLSAVMSRDYEAALKYCKTILQYEPGNKIVQEFYPLIQEKIQQAKDEILKEDTDSDENGGEEDDNNSFSSKSGSGTEFTSGSDFDNEDENGNSTSDDYSSTDGGGWITALNTDSDSAEKEDNECDHNSNPTLTTSSNITLHTCAKKFQSLSL